MLTVDLYGCFSREQVWKFRLLIEKKKGKKTLAAKWSLCLLHPCCVNWPLSVREFVTMIYCTMSCAKYCITHPCSDSCYEVTHSFLFLFLPFCQNTVRNPKVCISTVPNLAFSAFEWQIETTTTWCFRDLFPLQNVWGMDPWCGPVLLWILLTFSNIRVYC